MKTHLPVALRKALLAALVAVSYVNYSPAAAVELPPGDIVVDAMDNNTTDKTLHTGKGNVTIGKISNVKNGDVDQGVDSLDIIAKAAGEEGKGNINIGTSAAAITNATMTADGNITFGETAGASEVLEVRGLDNDERDVSIQAKGDIVFNQTVEIHPGEGAHPSGDVEISAGGEMHFLGEKTTIQNGGTGNSATTTIVAVGPVKFENVNGTEIGSGVKFNTTKAGSDINITTNGTAWINRIAGTVGSAGAVSVFGSTNQVLEQSGIARIHAADGISITATKENSTQNAELKSQDGPLTLTVQVSGGDEGYNTIYSSSLEVVGKGNVEISGGDAYLRSASVTALQDDVSISGGYVFVGQSLSDTSASTLDAAGKIDVAGATVSIQDSTSIDSVDGNVSITASGSDTAVASSTTPALSVTGGNVSSRSGDVKIAAENGTAALEEVEVNGDNVSITGDNVDVSGKTVTGTQSVEIAGTASTTISDVDVSGSGTASLGTSTGATAISDSGVAVNGQVAINGSGVSITDNKGIDAGQGGVTVAAAAGDASIAGGSVKGGGNVTVSATGEAKLTNVEVNGNSASVTGKNVDVSGKTVTGAQSVEIAGTASTTISNVDVSGSGTASLGTSTGATEISDSGVAVNGQVAINGSGVSITDNKGIDAGQGGVTVAAAAGDASIAGGSVKGGGNVTVSATGEAKLTNVEVNGNSASVTGKNVDVSGKTVTGAQSVEIAGTASTTISNVDVSGSGTASLGTSTGATEISDSGVAVNGQVDIKGSDVSITDNEGIDAGKGGVTIAAAAGDASITDGSVKGDGSVAVSATGEAKLTDVEVNGSSASITGNIVEVSGKSVTGAQSVEIAGTASTTISNVDVSGSGTASLGTSTGATEISDSGVAVNGQVAINGSGVSITDNKGIDAGKGGVTVAAAAGDASITGGSVKGDGSVAVSAMGKAKLTDTLVEGKDITTSGKTGTELQDTTVDGSDVVTVASEATTQVQESIIRGANTTVSGADTSITLSEVSADETVTITGTTTARVINSELSGDAVNLNGGALTLQDAASVKADAGDITVDAASLTIGTPGGTSPADSMTAKKNVAITVTDGSTIQGAAQVVAETGAVTLNGGTTATNLISGTGTSVKAEGTDGMVDMDGKSNTIAAAATVTAAAGVEMDASVSNRIEGGAKLTATSGNVTMTAATQNTVADSTVTADNGSIAMGGAAGSTETVQNEVTAAAGTSPTLTAEQDVTITGENSITGSASADVDILTRNGDISIHGDNKIQHAGITAAGGVAISTGTGDKATRVEDADVSGMTVTIAGDTADDRSEANLAVVTGAETYIGSRGEDAGVGITLNNVSVVDTGKGTDNIKAANGGHIAIRNRVDVFNGSLTIQSSDSYDSGAGRIVVDGSNVLNMKADSSLEGRLSGAGSINKSGGDELLLDRDHRDFSGTIYANGAEGGPEGSVADADNAGSWIQVTDAGVGEGARMVLKNTDLVIETWETQIGSLDTTQDAGANKASTGGTLGADASYTADGNTRADFKTIGSVVEVNTGVSGDVVHAANLALSDATLLKLDATVDAGGNATSDIIAATGTVDVAARTGLNSTSTAAAPSTARVYINHTDRAVASQVAEGTRTTIMSGTMAGDINEDVLYDVEKSANGTYQRTLQDRNVHLENKGDRVDLVFSKNYRSAAKTAPMQKVAEAIRQYSDAFHHSEGWLASSDDQMAKLVDAFDYTRSEAAAQRGLQSLAGMGNVLPQLMLFDASRHHLNQLRKQMEMPVCPRAWKGAPARKSNAWLTYTGAHDSLNGDANMGDYTRSAHGAMMGVDTALTCKLRAGLSLGYETASGEADSAKVDADSIFVDAYATAYTGNIKHRASVGLALTSFDSRRGVEVEAGYHSFHGTARSDTDALTLNFGYEISSDYKLSERSWLTRFASLNLAWHNLDDMKESSLGEIGLVSEYDSEWQAGVAVGLAYNREFAAVKYEAPAVFSAHAAVHFELLADKATATNRFSGADAGWEVESMDREQLYFELGAGVMVPLSPAWTASAGAAVEVGADRSAFSGNVGVRYAF